MSDDRPELRSRLRQWFEGKRERALRLLPRPAALAATADRAQDKAARAGGSPSRTSWTAGKLKQAWADVQVLVRLVRAFARGDYREVSRGTIGLIVGALVYFISPIDAILDHIPLTGYLDDAAILAWVMSEVRTEIEAFRAWEATGGPPRALPEVASGDQSPTA
jgi:uncharacterized membrane protein YkvA (DUF1232 family)